MADRFAVAPLLLPIADSFHLTLAQVSTVASLYFLAYGLMPAVFGLAADRYGRILTIRVALAGTALADLLSSLAPGLSFLLVARVLTGAFACGVMPTTLVYVADRYPFTVRQEAITRVLTFVALGTATGTVLAGLIAHYLNWRLFFLLPATSAAVLAVMLGRVPESLANRSTQNPWRQVAMIFANGWAVFVLAIGLLVGAVMFGFITYLAPALEAQGQNAAIAGTVVATYGLSVLVCIRVFRRVARILAVPLILAAGAMMLLVGYLSAAVLQSLPTILLASVLAGGAYAFMQSTFQTWATDVVPDARATASSLFATTIFAGAGLATAAVAALASARQYSLLFLIAAGVTLPVLILGSLGRWRYPGSEASSEQPGAT